MSKASERRARTIYRVTNFVDPGKGLYTLEKRIYETGADRFGDGHKDPPYAVDDTYQVTCRPAKAEWSKKLEIHCDCFGFSRQHYPKIMHKHIQIVFDYQRRGEPFWVDYQLGPKNEVIFVRQIED